MPSIPPNARHLLTPSELQILQLLPAADTAIARRQNMTVHSVRRHLFNIRRKFDIPGRAELLRLATQILDADEPINYEVRLNCPYCRSPLKLTVEPGGERRPRRRRSTP